MDKNNDDSKWACVCLVKTRMTGQSCFTSRGNSQTWFTLESKGGLSGRKHGGQLIYKGYISKYEGMLNWRKKMRCWIVFMMRMVEFRENTSFKVLYDSKCPIPLSPLPSLLSESPPESHSHKLPTGTAIIWRILSSIWTLFRSSLRCSLHIIHSLMFL